MSISERYGVLNLLINASGVLSIPNVMQPGTDVSKFQSPKYLNVTQYTVKHKNYTDCKFAVICQYLLVDLPYISQKLIYFIFQYRNNIEQSAKIVVDACL